MMVSCRRINLGLLLNPEIPVLSIPREEVLRYSGNTDYNFSKQKGRKDRIRIRLDYKDD
jgi:hypothetical protein